MVGRISTIPSSIEDLPWSDQSLSRLENIHQLKQGRLIWQSEGIRDQEASGKFQRNPQDPIRHLCSNVSNLRNIFGHPCQPVAESRRHNHKYYSAVIDISKLSSYYFKCELHLASRSATQVYWVGQYRPSHTTSKIQSTTS